MRRRNVCVWAIAGCLALAVVLAVACQPGLAAVAGAGMSAPGAPRASIETAPGARILPSHFGWCRPALRPAAFSLAISGVRAGHSACRPVPSASGFYGPIYRRPPPNFS